MRDAPEAIRTYLTTCISLTDLIGTRLYMETDTPGTGYTPAAGGALCLKIRGGAPDYSDALVRLSLQAKCYGPSEQTAQAVYRALYDALHNTRRDGLVRWGQCEQVGVTLTEPETWPGAGWPFVLAFFTVYVAME